MSWRDTVRKMLDERVVDCEQDYRRAMMSNVEDSKLLAARQALDRALMQRDCYQDGRAYGSGSGNSDDYSKSYGGMDDKRKAPYLDYRGNKWNVKRYG
jgi:hypothetical protein